MSLHELQAGEPGGRIRVLIPLAVGAIVTGLGLWAQNSALVGSNYDDGVYALLARSLSTGEGYRLTHLPVSLPGIKYPPVYPLSLVPFWLLTSSQDAALLAMKLANGFYIGLAAGLFTFFLIHLRILPVGLAAAVAMLSFATGSTMLISAGLLSEPLYLVLLFLALLAADSLFASQPGARRWVAIGLLCGLVALTRTVGIALLPAAALGLWWRRGPRPAALVVAVALIVSMPWFLFVAAVSREIPDVLVPRYGSYLQLYLANLSGSIANAPDIVATNVGAILQTLGGKIVPQLDPASHSLLGGLLLVFAILGARTIAGRAPVTALYPWLYLAVISVWSFPPFRFVFTLFPLLLALAVVPVLTVVHRLRPADASHAALAAVRRGLRLALVAISLAVGANMAYREARALSLRVWDGAALEKSSVAAEIVDWVRANTEDDAVVAHELEPLIALYTGRHVAPNNYEPVHTWYRQGPQPIEPLRRLLVEMEVDYLAVRRDIPLAAGPIDALIDRHPGSLRLVHIAPRGILIFKTNPAVLQGAGEGGDRRARRDRKTSIGPGTRETP